ncbi:FAD-binding oxidoreductase [Vibrio sp. CAU 1672]|uniref:iron-sulfur cluster-binding protein n=1 Tax=Vibrio sp. CAU 1672 TaxID=3032594 RepID=UPI0023DB03B6|nr:FAD-binding oxidoreductase [Vibrio sp. CAU 1672]MDF2152858.1 FAD-binding oxidoreductase [Vibrio sp. CAU 1672]
MMFSLTPESIEIVDFYQDGENTRHYQFRLLSPAAKWRQAYSGQFFMLCVPGVGEAPFTFTGLPDAQGNFRVLVRKMGDVTQALFDKQVGDILGARGPMGKGWQASELTDQKILIIGGGCGMAPLVSIIEQLIEQQNFSQLEVVYAARNKQNLLLTPERDHWQHCIPMFNVVEDASGLDEQDYYLGTATGILPKVLHSFGEQPDRVLLAGPEAMMCAVSEYLVAYGIDAKDIYLSVERRMHCAVGLCGHCYLKNQYVCTQGPTFRWADVGAHLA